jgi:hypothetical protein
LIESALRASGGEADYPDIFWWIENSGELNEWELDDSGHQARPRYRNTVRGIVAHMMKEGTVERVTRGRYRLR